MARCHLTEREKKEGLEFYRVSGEKRQERDLEIIRKQQEMAFKQKNECAMERLREMEDVIVQVRMESFDDDPNYHKMLKHKRRK